MILTKMNHPNIISLYEYFDSDNYISIMQNYAPGSPIIHELSKHEKDFTIRKILNILWQLCRAIRHLKAKNIIWCNFHHDNIIYDGENVVICGFSESRVKVSRTFKQADEILGLRGRQLLFFFYFQAMLVMLLRK